MYRVKKRFKPDYENHSDILNSVNGMMTLPYAMIVLYTLLNLGLIRMFDCFSGSILYIIICIIVFSIIGLLYLFNKRFVWSKEAESVIIKFDGKNISLFTCVTVTVLIYIISIAYFVLTGVNYN